MASVSIIGVGAPQGDDWLGWELAERLRASPVLQAWRERISVTLHDHPGQALLAAWRGTGLVILLDVVRSGTVPGTLHRLDAAQLLDNPRQLSTHGAAGVAEAVQVAAALESLPESLVFYGVEADPGHREPCLSNAVEAVLASTTSVIEGAIDAYLRQHGDDH